MKRRVVITGVGIICSLGNGKENIYRYFGDKKNCSMKDLKNVGNYEKLNEKKAGYVALDEKDIKSEDDLDKSERMARIAIDEAFKDAMIDYSTNEEEIALSLSTSVAGSDYLNKYVMNEEAKWILNSKAYTARICKDYRITGGAYTTSSACASGTAGVAVAYDLVKMGKYNLILCGGMDHIANISIYGFNALGTLSCDICKPFDQKRDGINIGEGSAFFIIEEYNHAVLRKAKIYGEIVGYGLSNDAYHITSPDPSGKGAEMAMRMSLQKVDKDNSNIYVNAHGTGTKANDDMEIKAIQAVFEDRKIFMTSTKSLTGHCLGAAGSIELALSLLFLKEGTIPRTYNSSGDLLKNTHIINGENEMQIDTVISNSFAFGGNNATIAVRRV